MKQLWVVEYEIDGKWHWAWAEPGRSFPSRILALESAKRIKNRSNIPTRIRAFVQRENVE